MKIIATQFAILAHNEPSQTRLASRRSWLKGLGALLGTGVLATPTALLAAPAEAAKAPLPASALVGGDEYIGMVKILGSTEVPQGWTPCDGRTLPVAEHRALFAIVGTTYGGDGRSTFALPDLRETMPLPAPATSTPDFVPTPGGQLPRRLIAIKTANAPATTTALAELYLEHHRPRVRRQA
jgi:hypothetical protein